jgi:G3E family GTPase
MSQELEQNQMDQFERLLELSFLREKRKQMKQRLQGDEHSIQRLIKTDSEQKIRYQRKRQLVVFDELKFSEATQILEAQRQAKIQKIKNYMIFIALIVIVLGAVLYYFSE